MLVAADIGGTKTDLAIFSSETGPHSPLERTRVHSADYPTVQAMVKEFLAKTKRPVDRACFAVAGPVIEGRVKTTNLPWVIDERALAQELNLNRNAVRLINDLEAIARSIPILRPSDLSTLNAGEVVSGGAIAVIAPGTGLGESFLTWEGSRYEAHSSEGGHADFAPSDNRQIRLLEYMMKRFDHVSFEHVCSGIGIPNLYDYLRDIEHIEELPEVEAQLKSESDPTMVIMEQAVRPDNTSRRCAATADLFVEILAAESSNLALKFLATGGLYLAGGVAVHALPVLQKPAFLDRFKRKGRFADLVGRIPLHVITTPAGLMGAAAQGLETAAARR